MNKQDKAIFMERMSASFKKQGFLKTEPNLRKPTILDFLKAYITLAIPAAMLARITRKITGRKGTPLEGFLMEHYYDMSVKLLAKD